MDSEKRLRIVSWIIRLGLVFVFGYAAISALVWPREWVGFLPSFILENFSGETVLRLFSIFELTLAAWLLTGIKLRLAGFACAAVLAGITLSSLNVLIISFRDAGLAAAALALGFLEED